jgi:FAD/FMN-containing dehydrogenase
MATPVSHSPRATDFSVALAALRDALGSAGFIAADGHEAVRYLHDWSGDYQGSALAVLRPATVDEVQAVVGLCSQYRLPIIPQGGNTGLVCGAVIEGDPRAVVVSMERLNRVRSIDVENFSMSADAGAVLQTLKDAAEAHDMFFPLALGAQGSCQIGGNASTNAGGINVLRYGMTRDLILGLEAVLPNGSLFRNMTGLRKDNRGYDLKQLLIGAEGTLGIITGVELKLFPRPVNVETAYLGVASFEDAMALLRLARRVCSDLLTAFEVIGSECIALAKLANPDTRVPLHDDWAVHVIMELGCSGAIGGSHLIETVLAEAYEAGILGDGVVAQSSSHAKAFWAIRENLVEGQAKRGRHIRTDLSVRLGDVARLIERARNHVRTDWPGWQSVAYGHAGDGNIHFNVLPPEGMTTEDIRRLGSRLLEDLYTIVREFGGSFSAEHGVGRSRRDIHWDWLAPEQRAASRALKAAFDPLGIMNPGSVLLND